LKPLPERSEFAKFLLQFTNGFMIMLTVAGLLAIIAYGIQPAGNSINLWTAIILFVVVILNCLLSYY